MTSAETPNVLAPAFQFGAPNESVLLAKDRVSIEVQGKTYTENGEVWLDLLPRPAVRISAKYQAIPFSDRDELQHLGKMTVTFGGEKVDCILTEVRGFFEQEIALKWRPLLEPIVGRGDGSTTIQRLVFHIFNFKKICPGTRRSIEQHNAIEHIDLKTNNWSVELRSLVETPDHFKILKKEGGYGLTHIGCLEKTDGTSFSGQEAKEALDALRFFLSFAKGAWCEPVCAVGFDKSDNRVWESWSSPREPWCSPLSWFDPHTCKGIEDLFPGFLNRWADENWRKALHEVIYWYLLANNLKIDAGIILTQAAIERLSFEYVVNERVKEKKFKKLRASEKFKRLLSSMDISITIPEYTPVLGEMAKKRDFDWVDAPHAITEVRNSLVHPGSKRRGHFNTNLYFETWNLGLWYLELALLRLCGYSGKYANRLALPQLAGRVEDVPWKKKD